MKMNLKRKKEGEDQKKKTDRGYRKSKHVEI
jgi:hypothetical protein